LEPAFFEPAFFDAAFLDAALRAAFPGAALAARRVPPIPPGLRAFRRALFFAAFFAVFFAGLLPACFPAALRPAIFRFAIAGSPEVGPLVGGLFDRPQDSTKPGAARPVDSLTEARKFCRLFCLALQR
jgi:hypothetical protein